MKTYINISYPSEARFRKTFHGQAPDHVWYFLNSFSKRPREKNEIFNPNKFRYRHCNLLIIRGESRVMSATLIQQTSTIFCTHLRSMLCPAQPLFKLSCSQSTAFASSLSCERLHWQYTNPALRDLPRLDRRGSRRTCSQRTRSPRSSRRATRRTCRVVAKLLANFRQHVARFRQYRHRFLQENMRFAAFFKIYQII